MSQFMKACPREDKADTESDTRADELQGSFGDFCCVPSFGRCAARRVWLLCLLFLHRRILNRNAETMITVHSGKNWALRWAISSEMTGICGGALYLFQRLSCDWGFGSGPLQMCPEPLQSSCDPIQLSLISFSWISDLGFFDSILCLGILAEDKSRSGTQATTMMHEHYT